MSTKVRRGLLLLFAATAAACGSESIPGEDAQEDGAAETAPDPAEDAAAETPDLLPDPDAAADPDAGPEADAADAELDAEEEEGVPNPIAFATTGDYLGVWDGFRYEPLFIKGSNLGVGVPGTQPGELAATKEQYARWMQRMSEEGFNSIRTYTLHYPRFYEALAEHNAVWSAAPIYLLQGIWLDEDNPSLDVYTLTAGFDAGIEEVIDCIHGNRVIGERFGRAYGTFDDDVSPWVIGWVIGREIDRFEALTTNQLHPEVTSFVGATLRIDGASAIEAWSAARIDHVIDYERRAYATERPASMSSWPTLDPLRHPTEGSPSFEDAVGIDFALIALTDAPAGIFAVYHAYPYYPDFINEDPGYLAFSDEQGVNNYIGYLADMKAHYAAMPLLIGEFGVPSSWGCAHFSPSGMGHGGHDEEAQGRWDARQIDNIYDTGCAGGAVFAWLDEWWKRTWITDQIAFPRTRYPIWHNVTGPEANFGMIAFDLPPPDFTRWAPAPGSGRVTEVRAAADAAFFHVRIGLTGPLADGEVLRVGFDTYRDDAGETLLPGGVSSPRRVELALVVTAPDRGQLYVTRAYNLEGIWHGSSADDQLYRSTPTTGAPWDPVRWQNSGAHHSDDNVHVFPDVYMDIGRLLTRRSGTAGSSLDAVVIGPSAVEIRVPWTLVQLSDPSARQVMDDDRATGGREAAVTAGIALVVALAGAVVSTGRFLWEPWEVAPSTVEREKPAFTILGDAYRSIPDHPGG